MARTESIKFEEQRKKLEGICEENNLVFRFHKDRYPIVLVIQPAGGIDNQLSMLERAEEEGYRSPDAQLTFAYKDGDLVYRISETFTIGDALFNKLKNLFKRMHAYWLQYFYRDIIERGALTAQQMPVIDVGDDDIVDEVFDELGDDMKKLEDFEGDGAIGEEVGGYEYDAPAGPDDEA